MDTLALTDRDGTYGAVKFAKACLAGRDPAGPRRRPRVRRRLAPRWRRSRAAGGRSGAARRGRGPPAPPGAAPRVDPRLPRVDLPGRRPAPAGRRCAGWSRRPTCAGERGRAGEHPRPGRRARPAGAATSLVLLGPGSELGRAADRRAATTSPAPRWRRGARWSAAADLVVEVVSHRLAAGDRSGPPPHAARMAAARPPSRACGAVLTNAVRYADRRDAPTVDVLDAARRLVAARPAPRRPAATPRGSSSPASRWPRSPRRSAGSPAGATAAEARRLLAAHPRGRPTGARSTRAPTSGSARCTSRSSTSSAPRPSGGTGPPTACCGPAARRAIGRRYGAAPAAADLEAARRRARGHRRRSATRRTSSPSPTSPT